MTLKELIGKVDFESLVPFIEKAEEKHLDSIYEYREAYDILRNMKPSENFKGEATVGWSGKGYGDKQWIGVFHLDGDDWEDALDKLEESEWRHQVPRRYRRYDFRSVTGPYVYGQVSLSLAGCIPIEYDKGYC